MFYAENKVRNDKKSNEEAAAAAYSEDQLLRWENQCVIR